MQRRKGADTQHQAALYMCTELHNRCQINFLHQTLLRWYPEVAKRTAANRNATQNKTANQKQSIIGTGVSTWYSIMPGLAARIISTWPRAPTCTGDSRSHPLIQHSPLPPCYVGCGRLYHRAWGNCASNMHYMLMSTKLG